MGHTFFIKGAWLDCCLCHSGDHLDNLVMHFFMDEDTGRLSAELPRIEESSEKSRSSCLLQVSVIEYNQWALASRFEIKSLHVDVCPPHDPLGNSCRACKTNLRNAQMIDQGLARLRTNSLTNVDHTWRHVVNLRPKLGQFDSTQASQFRRLE